MRLINSFQVISVFLSLAIISGCGEEKPSLTPLSQTSTILAFGDSLTYGTGTTIDRSYPSILSRLTGIKTINDGVSGEITARGKIRLKTSLRKYHPDLVILCHGGNDLIQKVDQQQTQKNLDEMINMIKKTGADVILIAVPEPSLLLKPAPFYRELAEKYSLPLEEKVLSTILANRNLKSDSVHPNESGYLQMAFAIANLMVETKAIKQLNSLE